VGASNLSRFSAVVAVGLAVMLASPSSAHKSSDSYLRLVLRGGLIKGQWDIALRDLDYAIGIDTDSDGLITWGSCAPTIGKSPPMRCRT
jgi:hypothetical protein